jgi:isoquinoline 1-oxidoreductase alpha subunit
MPFKLIVNGQNATVDVSADMPLLWVIRDVLNLRGTKYGCGMGLCGACTVHLGGRAVRSCIMSAAALLAKTPKPTDEDIDSAMNGNICRCGTYLRIRQAIHKAAAMPASPAAAPPAPSAVRATTSGKL